MNKVDVLIFLLGAVAYISILYDLRSYEHKLAQFELVQEKRRLLMQKLADRRKNEVDLEKATEKKVTKKLEMTQIANVAQQLGNFEERRDRQGARSTANG